MKRSGIPGMATPLRTRQTSRWALARILSAIRAIARAVATDHARALDAAAKAQLPRKNLAELRTTCATPVAPHQESDDSGTTPESAHRAPATRKVGADWPCWSAPFPKPRKSGPS
jgi:hypothetical protein